MNRTTMTEVVSSRSWTTAIGAGAFLTGAILAWLAPAPMWANWIALVLAFLGTGMAYRLVAPLQATLTVDWVGIRWTVGTRQGADVRWGEIRHLRHSAEDDTFSLDTGRFLHSHIPMQFLRTLESQARFLALVKAARPDLGIGRL